MSSPALQRVPEPAELMNDAAQAAAYAAADFSESEQLFIGRLEGLAGAGLSGRMLDLGCGPASIPLALAARHPGLTIDAVDGAREMLLIAEQRLLGHAALGARLRLIHAHLPNPALSRSSYDICVSNSLLHHLADPMDLWRSLVRCGRPGALVVVMDLARPDSAKMMEALIERHAGDAPEVLRRDFGNSLRAAYRVQEVVVQLHAAGLDGLQCGLVSDRHLLVSGHLPTDAGPTYRPGSVCA